ncbi:hypothetical protein [Candidatus Accumulibacter sp. ACC003]|uniref:hypothetical protein n=1 Tax=Candidatus Accumulibacter sp. ACC003 TaxID=2823334 RepID=UPI0025C12301|nr:hypothetical protein [Candidatus Accumulibacter sp. ACC003]
MYIYRTKVGVFSIVQNNGRWHAMFMDENLGSYISAQHAADDLAGGHTFTPPGGYDTSTLGIPEDIGEWERVR